MSPTKTSHFLQSFFSKLTKRGVLCIKVHTSNIPDHIQGFLHFLLYASPHPSGMLAHIFQWASYRFSSELVSVLEVVHLEGFLCFFPRIISFLLCSILSKPSILLFPEFLAVCPLTRHSLHLYFSSWFSSAHLDFVTFPKLYQPLLA